MQSANAPEIIEAAIRTAAKLNLTHTDGKWLEELTVETAPHIREWDISECWGWSEWPERESRFPNSTRQDIGIDAVARRGSDGAHIAIQCKARQLDDSGKGDPINKSEVDKFTSTSAGPFWAERWLITNGNNQVSDNIKNAWSMTDNPVKIVNITADLQQQRQNPGDEDCPHCDLDSADEERRQTKTCMQREAIAQSVQILREHEASCRGGQSAGEARGKIILPCGTGKTRISLRIVEELTAPGQLSIVLCPSIALVAQIRREYLQYAENPLRALAVCSDETAGYDPTKEGFRNTADDPTLDNSNVSASELKGKVTTSPEEIADWIREGCNTHRINVIFGTYQSGHRVAEALRCAGAVPRVLIADEAHRTAGLRRKRNAGHNPLTEKEKRVRDFTLCHDSKAFPAIYRVYQTATPRIYDTSKVTREQDSDWIVRSMDDETTFGVELYRKSYVEAVRNGWLADYRIIALGINDPDSYKLADQLADNPDSKGRKPLTAVDGLRGAAFVLAMGGATQGHGSGSVPIESCIAFMNRVDKSKIMAEALQSAPAREYLAKWLRNNREGQFPADYTLEHLDATSNVNARDNAKRRLAEANEEKPHGVINVGIFGEGTDSPSLNAVAFLEPRKSPLDVIQAVGRVMRTAPDKKMGYIICPILIPPNTDPEEWLSTSNMDEGWKELGQILLALRAHDQRIEDKLESLLTLYLPKAPEVQETLVAIASGEDKRIRYGGHKGQPGGAEGAVTQVLNGKSLFEKKFYPISEYGNGNKPQYGDQPTICAESPSEYDEPENVTVREPPPIFEPAQIITGKKNEDGSIEVRGATVVRTKPKPAEPRGAVDIKESKVKARKMINEGAGIRIKARRTLKGERYAGRLLSLSGLEEHCNAIKMNLLSKSGLVSNRIVRDLNILESSIQEAAHQLKMDDLQPALDRHFGLDNLKEDKRKSQADGCTIAALMMMNAAMLHQRIANGSWLSDVSDLETIKNDVNVVRRISREWNQIMRHDFRPVLEPAVKVIETIEDTGKLIGLERTLRHLTAEAERIAETYADMGADHAGPLFNRVMGNQASDGAFFTRPVAASIASRLTLDACGEQDWTNPETWEDHKTIDLACGSGTLLTAILADMKRRAREQGAGESQITGLQKLAVEQTIKGLDINPVSLQLAAAQLTAGNHEISYRRMGLHLMPYGPRSVPPPPPPRSGNPAHVFAGTLELLRQEAIVPRSDQLGLSDEPPIESQSIWQTVDAELEDAIDAVKNVRIVIMNPPFTNRARMGEKFSEKIQKALRSRVDSMERMMPHDDPLADLGNKNSISPLFVALAEHMTRRPGGIITMINPTIALSSTAGQKERRILAQRFHIHTVLTCHQPGNINLSQNTSINESIIVAKRHSGPRPPTRFINLDRLPVDEAEVADLHQCLTGCGLGPIPNGWGCISQWPEERIKAGDWTPAVWRSPELAEAANTYANHPDLHPLGAAGRSVHATGRLLRGSFEPAADGAGGGLPILKSKGGEGQRAIRSAPDEYWIPKKRDQEAGERNGGIFAETEQILKKAGYLLITAGQSTSTARLAATADDERYVGNGWMPVTGLFPQEAKAVSVFLNATPGRLQLMRTPGKKLIFPSYSAAEAGNIKIPDVNDRRIREILGDCWERTRDMEVPQYRDGECPVRRLWDESVADAMGWDPRELSRLRELLHNEPHVRDLGYNQYADEVFPETDASSER